jgi:dipeptidyl aminopeptidase/acylaminoacyl peptidase
VVAKGFRWATAAVLTGACVLAAGGVVLTETALHVRRIRPTPVPTFGSWREVAIRARDGAVLRGWLVSPETSNGNCVVTLHGVAGGRRGTSGLAQLFAENHYKVLMPDSRAHGESGGEIATYGLLERDDVHRWVDWLIASEHPRNVFAMGESLGAGVLLQSLAVEHRFSAVVVESPFADFKQIAEYRVAQRAPIGGPVAYAFAKPLVWSGFLYARWKYGMDFSAANPADVVANVSTPILLIHGLEDTNIPPEHSRVLASLNPKSITLWLVPGAVHTRAFAAAPEQFRSRVLGWFAEHTH